MQSVLTGLRNATRLAGNGEPYSTRQEFYVAKLGNHGHRRKGSESQEKTLRTDIAGQIFADFRTCSPLVHHFHLHFTWADPFLALNTATCSPCFF